MSKETLTGISDKYLPETLADIEMLTKEVEAHRLVIAWLLQQLPDDEGHNFLSRQANQLEATGQSEFKLVIDELDLLRSHVFQPSSDRPPE